MKVNKNKFYETTLKLRNLELPPIVLKLDGEELVEIIKRYRRDHYFYLHVMGSKKVRIYPGKV